MKELIEYLFNAEESATLRASIVADLAARYTSEGLARVIRRTESGAWRMPIYLNERMTLAYTSSEGWAVVSPQ